MTPTTHHRGYPATVLTLVRRVSRSFRHAALVASLGFGCMAARAQSLSNPNASSSTRAVFEYIKSLSAAGAAGPLMLGQHAGHGPSIVLPSTTAHDSQVFNLAVQPIFEQTGKWPAILSLDYEFNYARLMEGTSGNITGDLNSLVPANNKLKEWWGAGGLVTINWTPANPWGGVSNFGYPVESCATQSVNGGYSQPGSLNDLITPGNEQYQRWHRQLDTIASALSDLQNAGVTVLWRPMQEMDASWFWFGYYNTYQQQGAQFRALWADMYHYLVHTKQLNNLIWVFSPTYGIQIGYASDSGNGVYPGNSYVDVIGFTVYGSPLGQNKDQAGIDAMLAFGKPIAVAEAGPAPGNTGRINNVDYLTGVKALFPTAAFVVAWQSFPGGNGFENHAWVDNNNLTGAFNHPQAVDHAKLAFAAASYVPNDPTPSFATNLALGKTATAELGNTTAAKLTDGNPATTWCSGTLSVPDASPAGTQPCWVMVDLGATKAISRVCLRWQNNDGTQRAWDYQIQVGNSASGPWTDAYVNSYIPRGRNVDDVPFPAVSGRYVRVQFNKIRGNAYYGYQLAELEVYEANQAIPARATGLVANPASSTAILLAWQDNSGNETGFHIERKTGPIGTWTPLTTVGAGVTGFTDTGLTTSTRYDYRVQTFSASGTALYSGEAMAIPAAADTTAPVITLTGPATLSVDAGATYTDAGATATDNIDTSVPVTTTGTVNTEVPGVYVLSYHAADLAGNIATTVTRTVTVVWTAPVVVTYAPVLLNQIQATSATDLANSNQTSFVSWTILQGSTVTGGNVPSGTPAVLSDGVFGYFNGSAGSYNFSGAFRPVTHSNLELTTVLLLTLNGGYDLSSICTVSGSADAGFYATQQNYKIEVARVGSSTFTTLVSSLNQSEANNAAAEERYRTVSVTSTFPAGQAANIDRVRFSFLPGPGDNGKMYREIDVFGTAVVPIADTTPPVITLTGSSSVSVDWGSSYADDGATATDNIDTSVTVLTSGTVNTAKPGVYTLTYNATDAAANAATPVTRTVTVNLATTATTDGFPPLMRYAFGANSPTDTIQVPVSHPTATEFSVTAVVRADDPNLNVCAETTTDLTAWSSTGFTVIAAADQTNLPAGCVRQVYSIAITGAARKFVRFKATLAP